MADEFDGIDVDQVPLTEALRPIVTVLDSAPRSAGVPIAPLDVIVGQAIDELDDVVAGMDIDSWTAASLRASIDASRAALERGNVTSACNVLRALLHKVRALSRAQLTDAQAAALIQCRNSSPRFFRRRSVMS